MMNIEETMRAFDDYLEQEGHSFEAVIVGGAALNLLSITDRVTKDIDVLDPKELPEKIETLARTFAEKNMLPAGWLNTGPSDLLAHLPLGWEKRLRDVFNGRVISLKSLGRLDLLMTKCWAYCDRERDFDDIIAMAPDQEEIVTIQAWLVPLDANPHWPTHVKNRMKFLLKSLKSKTHE